MIVRKDVSVAQYRGVKIVYDERHNTWNIRGMPSTGYAKPEYAYTDIDFYLDKCDTYFVSEGKLKQEVRN